MAKFQNIKLPDLSSDPTVESGYYQIYFKGGEPYYVDSSDNVTKLIPDLDKTASYLNSESSSYAIYQEEVSGGDIGSSSSYPMEYMVIMHFGVDSGKAIQLGANYSDTVNSPDPDYKVNSPVYVRSSFYNSGTPEWKDWGRIVLEDSSGDAGIDRTLYCDNVIIR